MTTHVMQPKNSHDRESIYRFLYEIHADEFHRPMDGMDHEQRQVKDALDHSAQHFIAVDPAGTILGCLRNNILATADLPVKLGVDLKADELLELFADNEVCYASHFAVAPNARGKTVASLLIKSLYHFCLKEGLLIGLSYCALPFISFYYQLGYRPYTRNFRNAAGIRIPILHCIRDRDYLKKINSPLARICPPALNDHGAATKKIVKRFPDFTFPGFAGTEVHHLWARLAHTPPAAGVGGDGPFFSELTTEERRGISRQASEISFTQGEYIYLRGETESGMGVLLSGSLGVEVSVNGAPRIINIIQSGEPFGEICSLGENHRTVNLVALEKSQAFLFPFDFLERISRADQQLGLKLTQRLLKILAARFVNFADTSPHAAGPSIAPLRVIYPALYRYTDGDEIASRVESYRFDSLGDKEDEFKRLTLQATIGEDIEFGVLENLGLYDGARVLDLGSGPGVTSLLIARRLPSSTVVGVEPDDSLRENAHTLASAQGVGQRCRFIKGTGNHIPLDKGTVDFSYARLLFQHLPHPVEVLSEMKRVTRQNGMVAVLDVDDRSNIIHPAPTGLEELEKRIATAQAAAGGDRYVGRKLHGYMHEIGLRNVDVEHIPITAAALGREPFFSIVYSFKRQVLMRAGRLDEPTERLFETIQATIQKPSTFAMTTVFVAYGIVP